MQTIAQQQPRKRRNPVAARKQPSAALESLVYEVLDGRPLYYRGYEDVLAGKNLPEDIMGSSSLQWVLVSYFMEIMILGLNRKNIALHPMKQAFTSIIEIIFPMTSPFMTGVY